MANRKKITKSFSRNEHDLNSEHKIRQMPQKTVSWFKERRDRSNFIYTADGSLQIIQCHLNKIAVGFMEYVYAYKVGFNKV